MTIEVDAITVLNDIRERLAALTPNQLDWGARQITEQRPNETTIGAVTVPSTRALWVLFLWLQRQSELEKAMAETATEKTLEEDHQRQHALLNSLADVAREIFWAQAKVDLGYYKHTNVGLRATT